ncbi:SDR family NAD(P)-dependent oxidoreductase [Actinomycetospora flava]|uniref:SDR family oxidoreductase n=1 Tax=Actinomycetospora flava TaxID=3129232 RepID=A0ABU8M1I6_9PSEU
MDLQLTGKRVLVTGASRGIGLAIVRAFRDEGASVVAAARRSTPELDATGAEFVAADLATPHGPQELVDAALAADPRLDVLVNNVGGGDRVGNLVFGETTDEEWHEALELNLMAPVRITRAALPALRASRGAVVSVSSDSALTPRQGAVGTPIAYPTAKAALNATMKALSVEEGAQGVRVNTISPGATRTSLWDGEVGAAFAAAAGVSREDLLAALPAQAGLITGRWITPEEIAASVVFLASPLSASTIGANVLVDAGAKRAL